jgi:zinc/manganese transport system substrate-binding protein
MLMPSRRHLLALGGAMVCAPLVAQTSRPLRVVASFSILADLVAQTGGPAVDVTALVGPDADAHVFQPAPADVRRLAQAELLVVNGLHFEGWMTRLIASAGYRGPVLVCSDGLAPRRIAGAAQADPHAWQDLANARHYVGRIRDALVAARPAQAEALRRRAADYLAQIDALDHEIRAGFAAIAAAERRVVTSHDAFGHFAAAYGVEFIAARGWNTDSEPSAADVARLIRQIRQQRARAVFVENITDARLMQRIAQESGAVVGGTLYSDALSVPGSSADTYLKMFRHNARTLLDGLSAAKRS